MATKAIDSGTAKRRIRKVFGNIHEVVQMPNLIEVQRESYEQFLRSDPSIGYVSGLDGVISIDDEAQTADVQGMCTYEDLVDATLPRGFIPYVVPQLRTITLGGAVSGLGIESTSFRSGLPHESVVEMDIFTGAGAVVTTKPGEDLFDTFPNSYGSLGYATRLRIKLERVPSYVELRHVRFDDAGLLSKTISEVMET